MQLYYNTKTDSIPLQLRSDGETITVYGLPMDETIEWDKRTHYAYCYNGGGYMVDSFSFAWEKNNPSMLDFQLALHNFIDYYFEENEYVG